MPPEDRAENFTESDTNAGNDSGEDTFWQVRLAEAKAVQDAQQLNFTSMTDIPPVGASRTRGSEGFCLVDDDSGTVLASKEVSGGIEPKDVPRTSGAAEQALVDLPDRWQLYTAAQAGGSNGPAEETGTVIDYQAKKTGDNSYALGMDWEQAPDRRTPGEKLADVVRAAADRATDPQGWQSYLNGQIEKFIGIGEGLNTAKEHTKEAAIAGWTALTDGTVANFLSKPDAINDPLFKAVGGALDAMAQDPNAVNHALERLGSALMQASDHYSSLPDRQKGQVIGQTMFGMVNPEGSTEGAEAALKIADAVATHVDNAVMDGIRASQKAIEEMAAATPELAAEGRLALYDYTGTLGLSPQEMELAGIPKGYFDGIEAPGAAKGDNFFAMSKADNPGDARPRRTEGGMEREPVSERYRRQNALSLSLEKWLMASPKARRTSCSSTGSKSSLFAGFRTSSLPWTQELPASMTQVTKPFTFLRKSGARANGAQTWM